MTLDKTMYHLLKESYQVIRGEYLPDFWLLEQIKAVTEEYENSERLSSPFYKRG
jgi:hypothetical protein